MSALWQSENHNSWQQHYDDFCMNECGGGQPEGRLHDEACEYADGAMDDEDDDLLEPVHGDPLPHLGEAA